MNFRNLADDEAYQAICQELEAQLLAEWDPVEIEKQVRASQKARILVDQVTEGQWRKPPNPLRKTDLKHFKISGTRLAQFCLEISTAVCYAAGTRNHKDPYVGASTEISPLRGSDSVGINRKLIACNEMEGFLLGYFFRFKEGTSKF